jgi:ACS family glucarate transporter-like MFS transporter
MGPLAPSIDPPLVGAVTRGRLRFVVLALITLVLALSTGDRATLSVAAPGVAKDFGITPIDMGWLFSAFSWSYCLAQIPAGYLVDRIGPRIAIFTALACWSLATFLMSGVGYVAFPVMAIFVLRVVLGLLEAPVAPACGRIIAAWFPADERGLAGAIFNSAQYLSLAVFTPLMAALAHYAGWRHIFTVMGALGIVLAAVWFLAYFAPDKHPRLSREELEDMVARGALAAAPAPKPGPPSVW